MEPNEKAEPIVGGAHSLISWGGLALIGTTLYLCGANEWSLIPVFAGVWILWRGANTNGVALFVAIGAAIFLTRFGLSLERNLGFGAGWEISPGSILYENEKFETIPIVFAVLGICLGHWLFCTGIHLDSAQKNKSNRVVAKIPFYALGKWVVWFWAFIIIGICGFGVYEILLRSPDEILSSIGWGGQLRIARFLVLAWLLGTVVFVVRFWGWLSFGQIRSKSKSLGYLQDILWRETRREQSRSEQWIVRAVQARRKVR